MRCLLVSVRNKGITKTYILKFLLSLQILGHHKTSKDVLERSVVRERFFFCLYLLVLSLNQDTFLTRAIFKHQGGFPARLTKLVTAEASHLLFPPHESTCPAVLSRAWRSQTARLHLFPIWRKITAVRSVRPGQPHQGVRVIRSALPSPPPQLVFGLYSSLFGRLIATYFT